MKRKLAAISMLAVLGATCVIEISALAQNAPAAPAAPVGPGQTQTLAPGQAAAPAAAPTKQMLNNALNPQTRQTLQQAMDAVDPAALSVPVTQMTIGPGDAAVLDGTKIDKIAFSSLPAPVRSALNGGARRTLGAGVGP